MRKTHSTAHAAVRQRFEEADQVGGCSRALERRCWQGSGAVRLQEIPVRDEAEGRLGRTFNRPWLFLQCYGEGHAQRIAKTFGFGLNMTQRQLKRLEEQGVLVSRRLGNMRLFSFNERNPTVRNLRKLLEVELAALPEDDQQHYFRQRQRPRQSNKPLVMHG